MEFLISNGLNIGIEKKSEKLRENSNEFVIASSHILRTIEFQMPFIIN